MHKHNLQLLKNPITCIAVGFGSGLVPKMPGTFGTLVAVPISFIGLQWLHNAQWQQYIPFILVAMTFLAILISHFSLKYFEQGKDPSQIVIDEMVGYCIAVALLPLQWQWYLAAFVLFRFFDIRKPFPIGYLDKKCSGGFGIVIDDVAAGLTTAGLLLVVQRFYF